MNKLKIDQETYPSSVPYLNCTFGSFQVSVREVQGGYVLGWRLNAKVFPTCEAAVRSAIGKAISRKQTELTELRKLLDELTKDKTR